MVFVLRPRAWTRFGGSLRNGLIFVREAGMDDRIDEGWVTNEEMAGRPMTPSRTRSFRPVKVVAHRGGFTAMGSLLSTALV